MKFKYKDRDAAIQYWMDHLKGWSQYDRPPASAAELLILRLTLETMDDDAIIRATQDLFPRYTTALVVEFVQCWDEEEQSPPETHSRTPDPDDCDHNEHWQVVEDDDGNPTDEVMCMLCGTMKPAKLEDFEVTKSCPRCMEAVYATPSGETCPNNHQPPTWDVNDE